MSTRTHAQPQPGHALPALPSTNGAARVRPPGAKASPARPAVVGVGASAGGLEAFQTLLDHTPEHSDLSFVFVQHVTPERVTAPPELQISRVKMPVVRAEDGMRIEGGYVYVVPSDAVAEVSDGRLHVRPRPSDAPCTPVDDLFRSLARWGRERAIGVVLSGVGQDGAAGVREIKAHGGVTMAQAPQPAGADPQPGEAIAVGPVDLVLPPEQIASRAAHLAGHPPAEAVDALAASIADASVREVSAALQRASGIDFRAYNVALVKSRVARRMALLEIRAVGAYVRRVQANPAEAHALADDLLARATRFFGDPEAFDALAAQVITPMLERRRDDPIRVWVPGCATGEEAYSVAICLLECLGGRTDRPAQILATDASEAAVETARTGLYPASIAADVPAGRLARYFTRTNNGFRVTKAVRDLCVFAPHDLVRDPPFSRLDLIVCRGVLPRLEAAVAEQLVPVFHRALRGNGVLMLGATDTVPMRGLFAVVDRKWRLVRKAATDADAPIAASPTLGARQSAPSPGAGEPSAAARLAQEEAVRLVLDRFATAAVLVDHAYRVIQVRGPAARYLDVRIGEANGSMLRLVPSGLLYPVRAALDSAARRGRAVRNDRLAIVRGSEPVPISVEVIPLGEPPRRHLLVLFSDRHERADAPPAAYPVASGPRRDRAGVAALRRELAATRQYVQSLIEELETASDERQSAHVEILASNDELRTTNEALNTARRAVESANEELRILNAELRGRNEALARANSDLLNLLDCVDMAVVVVGSRLEIRRFTPKAEPLFNLRPGDIGRPIGHVTPAFEPARIDALVRETMGQGAPHDVEVRDRDGHRHRMRITPCKGSDDEVDGAIITVVNLEPVEPSGEHASNASDSNGPGAHGTAHGGPPRT